jgi:hypothetical protein
VAPQPLWESEPSDQGGDTVSLEVIETIRELKCFLADGKMQVALFGSPSELPDGWLRNCPWDQVFRSYPNLLPLDQRLSLQEAQKLVPCWTAFVTTRKLVMNRCQAKILTPRFQESCHPSDQYTRGLEDMTNASLQRGRQS